jgi:hypothetical protein
MTSKAIEMMKFLLKTRQTIKTMEQTNMKENRSIMLAILSILIVQLVVLLSNEFRFGRMETKIDQYFAPIEDVELPAWEENP